MEIKRALELCGNDPITASQEIVKSATKAELAKLASTGAWYLCHQELSRMRKPYTHKSTDSTVGEDARANAMASTSGVYRQTILDTYMVDGTPLGDCTRDDLRRAVDHRKRLTDGLVREANFLAACAKLVKVGKVLRECVKPEKIEKLNSDGRSREC